MNLSKTVLIYSDNYKIFSSDSSHQSVLQFSQKKYHKMTRNLHSTSFHSSSGINERNDSIICLSKSPGSHPVFSLTTKCLSNQAIFFYTQCHVLKLSPSLIVQQVVSLSQALLLHSSILLQPVILFLFFPLKKLKCCCVS